MGIMATFVIIEKLFPRYNLPYKKGWLGRAVFFNFVQLFVVLLGSYTWELWIYNNSGGSFFKLLDRGYSPFTNGLIAYLVNTWIFYWWHRARHEIPWMWLVFHQFYHSPERIETITSFYKHPFEVFANSIIMTTLMYPILGLNFEANVWLSIISALGEFFYHMNVRTPHWIGYFIQRPESHRLHHLRNKRRCVNYADLPIWDILGGTFENPVEDVCLTGFSNNKEDKVLNMMMCQDVISKRKNSINWKTYLLLFIGLISTVGYISNTPVIKGIGYATAASPLPLVFSVYNGVETFSTVYNVTVNSSNGIHHMTLNNTMYDKIRGPYNRRNMFGVLFSHGPFFTDPKIIQIRDQVLTNALCNGVLASEFNFKGDIYDILIEIRSKTVGFENRTWVIPIHC
jgi:sterol desaturase/sphingolipid hydroxylase (fatty acid hydroxylase superfamily)